MSQRLVAFGAHPDDVELRAGGTVAKYVAMGWDVTYVVAIDSVYVNANYEPPGARVRAHVNYDIDRVYMDADHDPPGDRTYMTLTHKDVLAIRAAEAARGAATLGTDPPTFLHLKPSYYWVPGRAEKLAPNFTGTVADDEAVARMKTLSGNWLCTNAARTAACVREVGDLLAGLEPEIVLTQQPNDLHPEHYAVCSLVLTVCRQLLAERGLAIRLYAWEMGSSGKMIRFVPDAVVDISGYLDTKLAALRHFGSQSPDPEKLARFARRSAAYWGRQIGVAHGEPFCRLLVDQQTGGFDLNEADFAVSSLTPADVATCL